MEDHPGQRGLQREQGGMISRKKAEAERIRVRTGMVIRRVEVRVERHLERVENPKWLRTEVRRKVVQLRSEGWRNWEVSWGV